jgi:hypothetical protein
VGMEGNIISSGLETKFDSQKLNVYTIKLWFWFRGELS